MEALNGIERKELLDLLMKNGFDKILDILYSDNQADNKIFTRKGRLNKSGACRALNMKQKDLDEWFEKCKTILGEDWKD